MKELYAKGGRLDREDKDYPIFGKTSWRKSIIVERGERWMIDSLPDPCEQSVAESETYAPEPLDDDMFDQLMNAGALA